MTPLTRPSNGIGTTSIDSGSSTRPTTALRGSAAASPTMSASLCSATHPVSPVPTWRRSMSAVGLAVPRNVPWKAIGSHQPVAWSTR